MLTKREKADRRFDVENALANQRLEGLEVDAGTAADLKSYASGEMDLKTARERALARIAANVQHIATVHE